MPERPTDLIYALDEKPPLFQLLADRYGDGPMLEALKRRFQ